MVGGVFPEFLETGPSGTALLGASPTIQSLLASLAAGSGQGTGGFGGAPKGLGYPGGGTTVSSGPTAGKPGNPYFPGLGSGGGSAGGGSTGGGAGAGGAGTGGGGGRGIALPPGSNPLTHLGGGNSAGVPPVLLGQGNTADNVRGLVQTALKPHEGGGGGTGGGSGGAGETSIGKGESAEAQGQRFADSNVAVSPSLKNSLQIAGMFLGGPTGLLESLATMAVTGSNPFNTPGPALSPAQQMAIAQAYSRYGPAYAQAMLSSMRGAVNNIGGTGLTLGDIQDVTPVGMQFGTGFAPAINPVSLGSALGGGGAQGGGGVTGGGGDGSGGLGGGPGNMGGGQNRQD